MKAVLIVNKLPKSCRDCKFCSNNENSECLALIYRDGTHHFNTYEYWHDEMPDWCPLKLLPKPKTEYDVKVSFDYDADYAQGFNDCLNEISGGVFNDNDI